MFVTEFCELHESEYMEILQHISIRWLSLERCVTRILMLYDPLASYFKSASMASYIVFIMQLLANTTNTTRLWTVYLWYAQPCFLLFIDEKQPRFRRLQEVFSDPMTEVYPLFFQATIPVFTSFNLLLQREQSSIFLWHDEVQWEGGICFCCTAVCGFFHSAVHWVTYNFLNYCVVDKLYPQAVCKVHGAYSTTGSPRASRHHL